MDNIVEEVRKLKDILYAGRPSYLIISSALADFLPDRVVVTEEVGTAATDSKYLYISPKFWGRLGREEKIFTLSHEMLHYILGDPELIKGKGGNAKLWNIAADCVINRELLEDLDVSRGFKHKIVTPETLAEEIGKIADRYGVPRSKVRGVGWFDTATKQEIYYYLVWLSKFVPKKEIESISGYLTEDVKPSPYSEEDAEVRKDRFVAENERIRRFQERAGRGVAGIFERVIESVEPKIDWRIVLNDVIAEVAEEYVSTWRRPSRRHEVYPGYERYGMPGVVALIDISGSIGERELSVFMTELKSLMEEYGIEYVVVIYWHSRVERVAELMDVTDLETEVKVVSKLPSGGTELVPALRKALEFRSNDRVVVVFTDGLLADDNEELKAVSDEVASSFARVCMVYTVSEPRNLSFDWITVRYPLS